MITMMFGWVGSLANDAWPENTLTRTKIDKANKTEYNRGVRNPAFK